MEFVLRCNDLSCRTQLHDRAVVTTCSHVFCSQCAESSKVARPPSASRVCPACNTQLTNPDDVVIAGLNPSEDYKTSVLSGLSPSIIVDCASRALAFYSYQASQEVIYQEHYSKTIADKYANLNQQMDTLINDANVQIKGLQDKIQAMEVDQATLESKNAELFDAYHQKGKALQQSQKQYQALKAQVMATQMAHAAGDEADHTVHTARGERYVDRLPGARSGATNLAHLGPNQRHGPSGLHNRVNSGSSGSGEQHHPRGGVGLGPSRNPLLQARGFGRNHAGSTAHVGTPLHDQVHRSRLPVLGSARPNSFINVNAGPSYQPSPVMRQPVGESVGARNAGGFGFGARSKRNGGAGGGTHGRLAR